MLFCQRLSAINTNWCPLYCTAGATMLHIWHPYVAQLAPPQAATSCTAGSCEFPRGNGCSMSRLNHQKNFSANVKFRGSVWTPVILPNVQPACSTKSVDPSAAGGKQNVVLGSAKF